MAISFALSRGRKPNQRRHRIHKLPIPDLIEYPELQRFISTNASAKIIEKSEVRHHDHQESVQPIRSINELT
jgi:hypothetical protein